METATKIDIISDNIYCYDELDNTREIYPLTSEYDFFINKFSDTQELLSINIYSPIPRIMKFYKIENSIPKSFIELDYIDMTEEEKNIWDSFVEIIKSKK